MKNGKKLLLLLLVLAVLVGATAIVGTISKNAADQEDETQTVFSLDPENVTNLGWDYSEKVSFTAGEGDLLDRKSTRLNSSHTDSSRMPSSA